jgi:S-adenosylhomocysteine hydrolase
MAAARAWSTASSAQCGYGNVGKRLLVLAKERLVNLGCATGPPELCDERLLQQPDAGPDRAVGHHGKYENKVYVLVQAPP